MNLFKFSSVGFLFLFSLIFSTQALAVGTPPVVKTTTTTPATTTVVKPTTNNVVVLATVNIQKAKIVSQDGNDFSISFGLVNNNGVQSGVKYGVQLINIDPKNQYIVDEMVYPESMTLTQGVNFSKSFKYSAPTLFSGSYNLFLVSKNESGLLLGKVLLGKVTLKTIGTGLEITPSSCFLQVVGEKGSPHYTLAQAVEIAKTEKLSLTCSAVNSSKDSITVKPVFETLYQSSFGKVAPQTGGSIEAITLAPKETKTVSLILPTSSTPQVYSVNVKLSDEKNISNTINASYTLSGPQATILNFTIDKNSYKKGETAKFSFVYVSPNINPKSRVQEANTLSSFVVKATMVNSNGKECITPISQDLAQDLKNPKVEIPATVTKDCTNPKASVTLLDNKGNVLDQKDFSLGLQQPKIPAKSNKLVIIFTIIGLLIVAGVAYYFISLKKKQNETNPQ